MHPTIVATVSFTILALSSQKVGELFAKIRLPLISGFLFTGMLIGPYVLGLIRQDTVAQLHFVDQVSLAIIAFAAGTELFLKELRSRLRSIVWVTCVQTATIFGLAGLGMFFLASYIPFMREMPVAGRLAVSFLASSILVARSPSSAIAVVNELRAKGPFTQTVLGVTMVTDVVVIVLFAISLSLAQSLLSTAGFNPTSLLVLLSELLSALVLGISLGRVLRIFLRLHLPSWLKKVGIVLLGYGVFALATWVRHWSHAHMSFSIHLEPLLICMIGSFVVTNFSRSRDELMAHLHDIAPPVYIAFFTLTGASLGLDLLVKSWFIALAIVGLRLVTLFLGSWLGGTIAGDPSQYNRVSWMTYITQAGVGLGLAKQVAVVYPSWGSAFATLLISVIVVNQIAGPPLFKWAIYRIKEAHTRAPAPAEADDREHRALLFGLDGRTVALARQLQRHGWYVTIATRKHEHMQQLSNAEVDCLPLQDLSEASLQTLPLNKADAVIVLLSEEENYQVCEYLYEHVGTKTVVSLAHSQDAREKLQELGVTAVNPDTALVSLFDHIVRSPLSSSFLLGDEDREDIIDLEVRDPALQGVYLRDINLPPDILILSILHRGKKLVSHGYTQLEVGDQLTVYGSPQSLEQVTILFEYETEPASHNTNRLI